MIDYSKGLAKLLDMFSRSPEVVENIRLVGETLIPLVEADVAAGKTLLSRSNGLVGYGKDVLVKMHIQLFLNGTWEISFLQPNGNWHGITLDPGDYT